MNVKSQETDVLIKLFMTFEFTYGGDEKGSLG